ncbi:MAG: zf-HC2 domain-containing protein [Chloroflexi bacterium]|uniref:Zf-HC2 domain-containing protein n=1 Tax=Candidatus Chlorohelix allophototropha TaxID=3003348 RepID=A0A8T7M867_9CHLR|nr:zf-HC2 domain-containing protein [Chloroflexota bacterium]WJW68139.1 zf-HC2 domain-containing protein [Chloroflexota bacterium L227-S17]
MFKREPKSAFDHHNELYSIHLDDYVDGRLTTQQLKEMEEHLASCESCREEVAGLQRVRAMFRRISAIDQPLPRSFVLSQAQANSLKPKPLYRFSTFAGAIAATLLVLFLALDIIGAFNFTSTRTETLAASYQLPTFGALSSVTCSTSSENGSVCAASDPNGPTVIYPANPPSRTVVVTERLQAITFIEIGLVGIMMAMAAYAFALRPRAPSRK